MSEKSIMLPQMAAEKCETPDPSKSFNRNEYLKKYRQMKLANETPEEATERRLKQREKARKIRQMKVENETPEEAAERRLKQRDKARRLRKIAMDKETPEQTAERLAKRMGFVKTQILLKAQAFENKTPGEVTPPSLSRTEYLKEYRLLKLANETPEEAAERRLKQREKIKRLRRMAAERETPEQAEKRRIKEKSKNKMYNQLKQMKEAIETPEEAAKRLLKIKEYQKEQYRKRRAKETPEQAAARRLNHNRYRQEQRALLKQDESFNRNEYLKKYRQMKLANETPEEATERRLKQREKARKIRQMKVENETPEEAAERRLKQRDKAKRLRKIAMDKETPEQTAERLAKRMGFVKTQILLKAQAFENKTPGEVTPPSLSRTECLKEYRLLKLDEKWAIQTRVKKHATSDVITDPIVKYENIDDEWDGSCTWSSFGASEGSYSRTSLEGSCSRTSTATRPQTTVYYNSDAPSEGKSEPSQNNGFFFEISEFVNSDASCNEAFGPVVVQDIIVKEEVDL